MAAAAPEVSAAVAAAADDANKVFAGNLSFNTTEDELKKVFEEVGPVSFIQIIKRGTRSLGYGFVSYESEADAQKAVTTLDKRELSGREINVEGAKPQAALKAGEGNIVEGEEGANGKTGRTRHRARRGRARGAATSRRPRNDEGEEGLAAESSKENELPEAGPNGGVSKSAKRRQKKKAALANGETNGEAAETEKPARQPRKPKGPPQGEPSKTLIFVANLPFVFSDEQLKGIFDGFKVKTATVVKRRFGSRTKGFAFVDFENESEQQRALKEVAGKEVEGRPLSVKVAIQGDDHKAGDEAAKESTEALTA